jgi:hypothetical protein
MTPTTEQIKAQLPESDRDSQIVIISKEEAKQSGLIETLAIQIGEYCAKVFRLATIKKVIFIVVVVLSSLDDLQIHILKTNEVPNIMQEYQNIEQWTQNIQIHQNPEYQNKYFAFIYPPNPTPEDETFLQLPNKILAPITGSANVMQDRPYQVWNPNSSIA